jgi:hypothetical protein
MFVGGNGTDSNSGLIPESPGKGPAVTYDKSVPPFLVKVAKLAACRHSGAEVTICLLTVFGINRL